MTNPDEKPATRPVDLTAEQEYRYSRLAAVVCTLPGPENCRHDWNAAHPDDQVTEAEQAEARRGT